MKNKLRDFARDCVKHYAEFDDGQYDLDVDVLPDFVLEEFASLIMSDPSYASEATGTDNAFYKTKMLPALLKLLKNSNDQDEKIEFINAWREGCREYNKTYLADLIKDALIYYNADQTCAPVNDYQFTYQLGA